MNDSLNHLIIFGGFKIIIKFVHIHFCVSQKLCSSWILGILWSLSFLIMNELPCKWSTKNKRVHAASTIYLLLNMNLQRTQGKNHSCAELYIYHQKYLIQIWHSRIDQLKYVARTGMREEAPNCMLIRPQRNQMTHQNLLELERWRGNFG